MSAASGLSVIMAVYNGEKFLEEALESILNQTRPSDEIIVIDDGSTDATPSILKNYTGKIVCLAQSNQGVWAARNHAVQKASGSFYSFMDADDISEPDRFARQMKALESEPGLDMVFGHMVQFKDSPGARAVSEPQPARAPGSLTVRREAFHRAGFFETRWKTAGFLHWCMTCDMQGLTYKMLPEVVLRRRIHGENSGIVDKALLPKEYAEVISLFIKKKKTVS